MVHFLNAPYRPWAQRFWEAALDPAADASSAGVCAGAAALLRGAHQDVVTALYQLHPGVLAPDLSLLQRLERVDNAAQILPEAQAAYDLAAVRACVQQTGAAPALLEVDIAATTRDGPRAFVAVRVAAVLPRMSERLRIALTASDCLSMDQLRTCEAAASAVVQAADACEGRVCVERLQVQPSPLNYAPCRAPLWAASAAPLLSLLAAVAPTLQDLAMSTRLNSGIFSLSDYAEYEVAPLPGEAARVAAAAAQLTALRRLSIGNLGRVEYMSPFIQLPTLQHISMIAETKDLMLHLQAQTQLRTLSLNGPAENIDLALLAHHTRLHALTLLELPSPSLCGGASILDLAPLADCTNLQALTIKAESSIALRAVTALNWLTRLCIRGVLDAWSEGSSSDKWDADARMAHWRAIAAPLHALPALESLDLFRNELGAAQARIIAAPLSRLTALTLVSLADCNMSARDTDDPAATAAALAHSIACLTCLRQLNVSQTQMYADGLAVLAPVLTSLPSLTKLIMTHGFDMGGPMSTTEAFERHLGHLTGLQLLGGWRRAPMTLRCALLSE